MKTTTNTVLKTGDAVVTSDGAMGQIVKINAYGDKVVIRTLGLGDIHRLVDSVHLVVRG